MASRIFPLLLAVLVLAAGCQTPTAAPPEMKIKTLSSDPVLTTLTVEQLIDRLQDEGQFLVQDGPTSGHIEIPAFARGFPLIDAPLPTEETRPRDPSSAVMLELARRSVTAIPALLDHLSDARPTKIIIRGPDIGGPLGFTDYYDYRYDDPEYQPKGVNLITRDKARIIAPGARYTVKVGDLCFGTLGVIVNRRYSFYSGVLREANSTTGSIKSRALLSPVEVPALATAARADWKNLTPAAHERGLREDVMRKDKYGLPDTTKIPWGALHSLQRLLYYYPPDGRKLAETLLARRLVNDDAVTGRLSDEAATCSTQATVVRELAPFQWERLDRKIYLLYDAAVHQPAFTAAAKGGRDALALECAKRLAGGTHDAEFRQFFAQRIAANLEGLSDSDESLQATMVRQANDRYRAFLQTLPAPTPQ